MLHSHNFLARFFSTPKHVNHDKTDFATKQRKSHKRKILQQNSIKCDKTSKIVHIILTDLSPHFSCGEISPCDRFSPRLKGTISAFNLKFLHMAEFFSTGTACGACDKYEVWFHALSFSIQLCLTLTHVSYEASLLKHQVCFSLRDP